MQTPEAAPPPVLVASLSEVVPLALRLAPADQVQLVELLTHITQGARSGLDVVAPGEPSVDDWLASLQGLSTREQVLAIEREAFDAGQHTASHLYAVREEMLRDDPALAMRLAVEKVAREHPIASIVGVLGLGLAMAAAARGLFRVLF